MQIIDIVRDSGITKHYRHIVLGLSGGPDSVCLFDVLLALQQEQARQDRLAAPFHIWPVHVNHMLRPGAADRDQAYVEALCDSRGLELKVVKADCAAMAREQDLTPEEAGRKLRYEAFFAKARELQEAGELPEEIGIAVAHHGDDQAETLLQRILRGTGTDGLAGMEPVRRDASGYDILRPLLGVRRREIEDYCRDRGLTPCEDQTNREPVYVRNRIRLELLPMMEEYNPRIVEALGRLAHAAAEDKACLEALAETIGEKHLWEQGEGKAVYDMALLGEPRALSRRVIARDLKKLGLIEDLTLAHFRAMLALVDCQRASAQVDLPHGYTARKEYDRLVLAAPRGEERSQENRSQLDDELGMERSSTFKVVVVTGEEYRDLCKEEREGRYAAFDRQALEDRWGKAPEGRITLRCRQEGDLLPIPGGRKKLQDVFVDDKVPRFYRDQVPVAAIGREVLWIPAQDGTVKRARFAAGFAVGEETREVVLLRL